MPDFFYVAANKTDVKCFDNESDAIRFAGENGTVEKMNIGGPFKDDEGVHFSITKDHGDDHGKTNAS